MLKAAINGIRKKVDHKSVPVTDKEIITDAATSRCRKNRMAFCSISLI